MTYLEFKELVKDNATGGKDRTDDQLIRTVATFVRANYSREFLRDLTSYGSHKGSYDSARNDLVGYKTSLSLSDVQTQVKDFLSDAHSESLFISTISKFVKSNILSEIEQNQELAMVVRSSYEKDRFRLVGYETALSDIDLRNKVRVYLPVDKDRQNTIDYVDAMIEEGKQDIKALGEWMDEQIEKSLLDIEGFDVFIDQQIRQGLLDLQHFIPEYRLENSNLYVASDMFPVGNASEGTLPEGAVPLTATLRYPGLEDICGCQVRFVPWNLKDQVICNSCNCEPVITFDPRGSKFLVYPQLLGDVVELEITWEGTKLDYSDGDTVVFNETAAKAISYFVLVQIYGYVEEAGTKAQPASAAFKEYRRRLASAKKRERRLNVDRGPATCRGAEPFSPIILTQPQGQVIAQGGTLTLGVGAIGNPGITYQWFKV